MAKRSVVERPMVFPEIRKRGNGEKYQYNEIVTAVLAFYQSGKSINYCAKQLNLQNSTLQGWIKNYGEKIREDFNRDKPDDECLTPDDYEMKEGTSKLIKPLNFYGHVNDARDKAVKRLVQLLPDEEDVKKVVEALKVLHDVTTAPKGVKEAFGGDEKEDVLSKLTAKLEKQYGAKNYQA